MPRVMAFSHHLLDQCHWSIGRIGTYLLSNVDHSRRELLNLAPELSLSKPVQACRMFPLLFRRTLPLKAPWGLFRGVALRQGFD